MTHFTKRHGEPEASSPAVADFSHSLARFRDSLEMLFPASIQGTQVVPLSVSMIPGGLEMQNSISETRHGIMILGWHPIALTGDYNWYSGAVERMNARPLNLYAKNPCVETPLTSFRGISDVFVPLRVILDTNLAMTPTMPSGGATASASPPGSWRAPSTRLSASALASASRCNGQSLVRISCFRPGREPSMARSGGSSSSGTQA